MNSPLEVNFKPIEQLLSALSNSVIPDNLNKLLADSTTLKKGDYQFFRIDRLSHVSDEPRREALENIYSCIRYSGASIVYMLCSEVTGISLYLGIARNYLYPKPDITISDIANKILQTSFEGNFRGSVVTQMLSQDNDLLINKLNDYRHVGVLQGTVGNQAEGQNEFFQGMDRLVDVMAGGEYCLLITASSVAPEEMSSLENWLHRGYEMLAPLAKISLQHGASTGNSISWGKNKGETTGYNSSTSTGFSNGTNNSITNTTSTSNSSKAGSEVTTESTTKNDTEGFNKSKSIGSNIGSSLNQGKTINISSERYNRHAQQWLSYIDDVLLPRLDYGRNRGGFICNITLLANSQQSLMRLGDASRSIFSGNIGNQNPLQMLNISSFSNWVQSVKNLQPTVINRHLNSEPAINIFDSLKSRIGFHGKMMLGAYVTPKELSLIAGLPQNEIVGLELKELVNFGLNPPKVSIIDSLQLGNLVQNGRALHHKKVNLNRNDLNKHVFIAGVTGSGKTTTCHHLLRESMLPFLVIEPAKTEYRMLIDEYDDLLVLTPGRDDIAPLKLNPLEIMKGETISSRVDIIKACFLASFEMEAAIPQVLEAALYRCYENLGWDLNTSTHPLFKDPTSPGCYPFPMLRDLLESSEQIVKEQGFDERLRQDYIGSIKARLQGLLIGAKGQIFNTLRSINFDELINRRVVIELEEIRNGAEKSLLIALIMTNIIQSIKNAHRINPNFRHLTLIEEAHHLLTRADAGTNSNRRQAIEMFADMLAEVRKYGEGIIIADQIPNKLTPEVLKNTNTKIVHKLFAEDDKQAIGNTIVLETSQQQHLSKLEIGQAVVFSQGWQSAVLTNIESKKATQPDIPLAIIEPKLRQRAWEFYCLPKNYHLIPLQMQEPTSSIDEWQNSVAFTSNTQLLKIYTEYLNDRTLENNKKLTALLTEAQNSLGDIKKVIEHIVSHIYIASDDIKKYHWCEKLLNCYPLLFSNNHAKAIVKLQLHNNNRRKY